MDIMIEPLQIYQKFELLVDIDTNNGKLPTITSNPKWRKVINQQTDVDLYSGSNTSQSEIYLIGIYSK